MQTTQKSVSLPVVQRYVDMLHMGSTPPPIKVDGNIIIEGNHRFVAGRVFGQEPPTVPGTFSSSQAYKLKPVHQLKVDLTDFGNK